jgi:hypothetical protein
VFPDLTGGRAPSGRVPRRRMSAEPTTGHPSHHFP